MSKLAVRQNPDFAANVLGDVQLAAGFSHAQFGEAYNPDDGRSYGLASYEGDFGTGLVGWVALRKSDIIVPTDGSQPHVSNCAIYRELPAERRDLSFVGKGIGSRMCHTREMASGFPDAQPVLCFLDTGNSDVNFYDARSSGDGTTFGQMTRIGRHLGKKVFSMVCPNGTQIVADQVGKMYDRRARRCDGDVAARADVVIINEPPRSIGRREGQNRAETLVTTLESNSPASLAIVRTHGARLALLQEYTPDNRERRIVSEN